MKKEEKTYIGGAEIRLENIERRDKLVEAARKAGFLAEYAEAINISFSGASSPSYWAITVEMPGRLNVVERREAREKLAEAWGQV